MAQQYVNLFALILSCVTPILILALRERITARIKESVRAEFEKSLEETRSKLRKSEEALKADLREKESQILAIRSGVLEGASKKAAFLYGRRMEALESIWTKFQNFSALKFSALTYATLNIEEVEKRAPFDPKLRQMVDMMKGKDPIESIRNSTAVFERIYIPEIIWATFSAYGSILTTCYMHLGLIATGEEKVGKIIKWDKVLDITKSVLPHQSAYIDKYGAGGLPHLLDEIETKMLALIKTAINDPSESSEQIAQATEILQKIDIAVKNRNLT